MIAVQGLTKRYGRTTAVDRLSFEVRPGQVTGFLGPNGAGKSTTMRVIMGLDAPDTGRATIGGRAYHQLRWPLREVGAMLEARSFRPGRTGRSHLHALAGAYLALIALIGMGAGLIIRHSAAAITTLCVVILLLPALTLPFSASVQHATQKFLPEIIAENSLTAVKPIPSSLTPWMGLAVLMLYAAVVVGAGTWLLARRDA
jgi:energy-coupling factor transporter ATP-binding protein EcfA2